MFEMETGHVLHMLLFNHNNARIFYLFKLDLPVASKWKLFQVLEENVEPHYIIERSEVGKCIIRQNENVLAESTWIEPNHVQTFDDMLFRLCMRGAIKESVLHLHSSFVLYNDQAILFTGPSGIGKTTQAELWRDYENAVIVNGDVTLIRKIEDMWRAFGAPIHGSSPYCENMDAPIAAIIVLKQAEENQLIQLDAFTALAECFPEIYRPEMSDETREILLDTVDALLSEIPVYQLSCRPDRESVELVKQTLFDQKSEL